MSAYYLADRLAAERAKQRELGKKAPAKQEMKATVLGDFLFPSSEPQGCDPYNSTHGKSARELWKSRVERR